MDIIDLTRFWIVSCKGCNSPWSSTSFLGRSLLLVIRCQVMAFSQLVAFHWAIAWCHWKLETDLPTYEPVVFASPGCGAPSAPCSVAAIRLLGAHDHLLQLPKTWPGVLWEPLWQVPGTFGAKAGPSPEEPWNSSLQELGKSRDLATLDSDFQLLCHFPFCPHNNHCFYGL